MTAQPAPDPETVERIEQVLAEHWDCIANCDIKTDGVRDGQMWYFIHWACGMTSGPLTLTSTPISADHRHHVAQQIARALGGNDE